MNVYLDQFQAVSALSGATLGAAVIDAQPSYTELYIPITLASGVTIRRGAVIADPSGDVTSYVKADADTDIDISVTDLGPQFTDGAELIDWVIMRRPEFWTGGVNRSDYFWFLSQIDVTRQAILNP